MIESLEVMIFCPLELLVILIVVILAILDYLIMRQSSAKDDCG